MLERTVEARAAMGRSDYARAAREMLVRKRGVRLAVYPLVAALLAALAFGPERSSSGASLLMKFTSVLYGLFLVYYVLETVWIHPWRVARSLRDEILSGESVWRFREEGFDVVTPVGEGKLDWAAVAKVAETKRFLLFFETTAVFRPLPKGAFATERDLADVRDLLARKVSKRA